MEGVAIKPPVKDITELGTAVLQMYTALEQFPV